MKTGYYLRFVPFEKDFCFYFYDGAKLFVLVEPHIYWLGMSKENYINKTHLSNEFIWQVSMHKDPKKKLGFEFVCDEEGK